MVDNMKKFDLYFEEKNLREKAEHFFNSYCNFPRGWADNPDEDHRLEQPESQEFNLIEGFKLKKEGYSVRDRAISKLNLKGRLILCGKDAFSHGGNQGLGLAVYMLTLGELSLASPLENPHDFNALNQEGSILKEFYLDTWGTAYVDSGRECLREYILEKLETITDLSFICGKNPRDTRDNRKNISLSKPMAPGFYNMDIRLNKDFLDFLSAHEFGVSCNPQGAMTPEKTITGMFIIEEGEKNSIDGINLNDSKGLNDQEGLSENTWLSTTKNTNKGQCESCHGNSFGCQFCSIGKEAYEK